MLTNLNLYFFVAGTYIELMWVSFANFLIILKMRATRNCPILFGKVQNRDARTDSCMGVGSFLLPLASGVGWYFWRKVALLHFYWYILMDIRAVVSGSPTKSERTSRIGRAFRGSIDTKASFLVHHVAPSIFIQMVRKVICFNRLFGLTHAAWSCYEIGKWNWKNKL